MELPLPLSPRAESVYLIRTKKLHLTRMEKKMDRQSRIVPNDISHKIVCSLIKLRVCYNSLITSMKLLLHLVIFLIFSLERILSVRYDLLCWSDSISFDIALALMNFDLRVLRHQKQFLLVSPLPLMVVCPSTIGIMSLLLA